MIISKVTLCVYSRTWRLDIGWVCRRTWDHLLFDCFINTLFGWKSSAIGKKVMISRLIGVWRMCFMHHSTLGETLGCEQHINFYSERKSTVYSANNSITFVYWVPFLSIILGHSSYNRLSIQSKTHIPDLSVNRFCL